MTYYNGVQPLTRVFEGFFVHSRGATSLPLVGPGEYADLAGALGAEPTIFRTDQDTPVLDIQTEGDVTSVLNSRGAPTRQRTVPAVGGRGNRARRRPSPRCERPP